MGPRGFTFSPCHSGEGARASVCSVGIADGALAHTTHSGGHGRQLWPGRPKLVEPGHGLRTSQGRTLGFEGKYLPMTMVVKMSPGGFLRCFRLRSPFGWSPGASVLPFV